MAGWKEVSDDIDAAAARGTAYDEVRRKHLKALAEYTKRNVIAFYSGWLQKAGLRIGEERFSITDADKSGFMAVIHRLDKTKGLDLILHSPGGDVGATESLGDYLRSMFGTNIRTIVPQVSLSCGTMLACLGKEIVMGRHSSIGPVDPQIGGTPAVAVVTEFKRAREAMAADPSSIPYWQMILSKYTPARVIACENAIAWSELIVANWLQTGMFAAKGKPRAKLAKKIAKQLVDHTSMKAHNRHISIERAQKMNLEVVELEKDQTLQELVLTVHHCYIATLGGTGACKIIENQNEVSVVSDVTLMAHPA